MPGVRFARRSLPALVVPAPAVSGRTAYAEGGFRRIGGRRGSALAAAIALAAAAPAHAAEPFVVASGLQIHDLVAEPDGGIAFTGEAGVFRIDARGALRMLAATHRAGNAPRLAGESYAIARDQSGGLLVLAGDRVQRVVAGGPVTTLAGGGPLELPPLGEPIPALSAKLDARNVAVTASGRVLLTTLDDEAGLVALQGDGTVRALPQAPDADYRCSPFDARLFAPPAGGDLLVGSPLEDTVCRLGDTGPPSVLLALERPAQVIANVRDIGDLDTLPDGTVLITDVDNHEPSRLLLIPPGADHVSQLKVAGDGINLPLRFTTKHAAVAPDGGLLLADDTRIAYLPPAQPGRLALRFDPGALRASRTRTRIALVATQPGTLRIEIGKRVVTSAMRAGHKLVSVPGRFKPGPYRIRATLHSPSGATTSATTTLVLGDRLTADALHTVLHIDRLVLAHMSRRDEDVLYYPDKCRRSSATRLDCRVIEDDEPSGETFCDYMATIQLGPDGRLWKRKYRCGHGFVKRPHWRKRVPVDMLGDVLG